MTIGYPVTNQQYVDVFRGLLYRFSRARTKHSIVSPIIRTQFPSRFNDELFPMARLKFPAEPIAPVV